MNKTNLPFEIQVDLKDNANKKNFTVYHQSETFDFNCDGTKASILNNGDNSWSVVEGNLDQEMVNLIGAEIEKYYNNLQV